MSAGYTIEMNAGESPRILAGALVRATKSVTLPLERIDASVVEAVDDGVATATPTLPAWLIEAGKTVKNIRALPLNRPLETVKDYVKDPGRIMTQAAAEAVRASAVVFDTTDTPQAKETGVTVHLVIQDADGNDQVLNSAFELELTVAGSGGSQQADDLAIAPDADHVVSGDGNEDYVRFINGRAKAVVTAGTAGEATVSMANASRAGITISDTQVITLT
jgi:hypothetical protein